MSVPRRTVVSHARGSFDTGTIDMRADIAKRRVSAELANNAFIEAIRRYANENRIRLEQVFWLGEGR